MDEGEVTFWEPKEPGVLRGAFHFYEGLNWAVRDKAGTVWLLDLDAEDQLRALRPDEGQQVQVMYLRDDQGTRRFHVSLH